MTSPYLFRPKTVGAGLVVNALTKYIGGHGNALGGAVTDTGLFDWTRYPEHLRQLQEAEAARCGASRRSARRACATWAARWPPSRRTTSPSARRRWRCAWSGTARTRWRWRASSRRIRRCAPSTTRASPRIRSTRWRRELFTRLRRAVVVRARAALDCFDFLNRLQRRRAVVEPRRQPHAGDSGRAHDFLRDGCRAPRARWASPTR